MIMDGIWDVLSLPEPHNHRKKWYLLLHQYRFLLDNVKHHVKSLQKSSKADKYVVHNLMGSGVYLMSTLVNSLLQKLLIVVPLTATRPGVYVYTINTFLSY